MISGNNPNLPVRYGASYKANALMAANTPSQVVAPAANVNGVIIFAAGFMSAAATTVGYSLIAKASAPANCIDGDVLLMPSMYNSVTQIVSGQLMRPVFVPPGLGVYFIRGDAETVANRYALYSIL